MIYDKYLAKLWLNSKVVDRNQVTFVQDEKCQKKKKKKKFLIKQPHKWLKGIKKSEKEKLEYTFLRCQCRMKFFVFSVLRGLNSHTAYISRGIVCACFPGICFDHFFQA